MSFILPQLPATAFSSASQALLLLAGSARMVVAIRQRTGIEKALFSFGIGILGLHFYIDGFIQLNRLSTVLTEYIQTLGDPNAFRNTILDFLGNAAGAGFVAPDFDLFNLPIRYGVWGIASFLGHIAFLLGSILTQARRDVLEFLVLTIFPLLWSLYPLFSRMGQSAVLFMIEMALWEPCLNLIQVALGYVAPRYMGQKGSLGLPILGMELVAIFLIFEVPSTVHRLVHGSIHPGGEFGPSSFVQLVTSAYRTGSAGSMGRLLLGAASHLKQRVTESHSTAGIAPRIPKNIEKMRAASSKKGGHSK